MKRFKRIFKNSILSFLQEPSEKKQDKGGSFNAWNGIGLKAYKHNVSETQGIKKRLQMHPVSWFDKDKKLSYVYT